MRPLRAYLGALADAAAEADHELERRRVAPRPSEREAAAGRFPSPVVPEPAPLDVAAHAQAAPPTTARAWTLLQALGEPEADRVRDNEDAGLVAQGARRCASTAAW